MHSNPHGEIRRKGLFNVVHTHTHTHRYTQIRVCTVTQTLKGTSATSKRLHTWRRRQQQQQAKDISLSQDPTLSLTDRQRRRHVRTDTPAAAALAAGRLHPQRQGYLGVRSSAPPKPSVCLCVWADALSSLPVRAGICKLGLHFSFFLLLLLFFFSIRTGSKQRRHSSFWLFYLTLFEIQAHSGGGGGSRAPDALTSLLIKLAEPEGRQTFRIQPRRQSISITPRLSDQDDKHAPLHTRAQVALCFFVWRQQTNILILFIFLISN